MAVGDTQIIQLRAFYCEQAMIRRNDRFTHVAHAFVGAECAPALLDAPDNGVLDWNDARIRRTFVDSAECRGESARGNALDRMSPDLGYRRLGVRTVLTLERDAHEKIRSLRGLIVS
jgi:hypothetical protein